MVLQLWIKTPCTPIVSKVLASAIIPAPPLGSKPAITNTVGLSKYILILFFNGFKGFNRVCVLPHASQNGNSLKSQVTCCFQILLTNAAQSNNGFVRLLDLKVLTL